MPVSCADLNQEGATVCKFAYLAQTMCSHHAHFACIQNGEVEVEEDARTRMDVGTAVVEEWWPHPNRSAAGAKQVLS